MPTKNFEEFEDVPSSEPVFTAKKAFPVKEEVYPVKEVNPAVTEAVAKKDAEAKKLVAGIGSKDSSFPPFGARLANLLAGPEAFLLPWAKDLDGKEVANKDEAIEKILRFEYGDAVYDKLK